MGVWKSSGTDYYILGGCQAGIISVMIVITEMTWI